MKLGKLPEARSSVERALALAPQHVKAHINLGELHKLEGDLEGALAYFRRATVLGPDNGDAHWNLAITLLTKGEFAEGWREYEWRRRVPEIARKMRSLNAPVWDGSPMAGKTLLLTAEQGLGDTIQFSRLLSGAKSRGFRTVLECQPVLKRLMRSLGGADVVVARGEALPSFDVWAPLMSLPHLLGLLPDDLPGQIPYLQPEPDLVERWRGRVRGDGAFRIGLWWQGNPTYGADSTRSVALRALLPVFDVPGVRFFVLQKQHGLDQLEELPAQARSSMDLIHQELDVGPDAFVDTAAVMEHLDLNICSDTSMVHLAGALGRPTWMLLPERADWRWEIQRSGTPWYPSVRIFRQTVQGQWDAPIQNLAAELRAFANPTR